MTLRPTATEVLDLAGNPGLASLPKQFARLTKLRVLFLLGDGFTTVPRVLGALPK